VDAFEKVTRMLVGLATRSLTQVEGEAISVAQFRVLAVLDEQGSLASSKTAAALGLNASSVTRLADRLEAADLLTRTREPDNRSVVTLALTAEGRKLVQRVLAWRRTALTRLLRKLDPDEVATAANTLDQLATLAATDSELADLMPYPHG
jgi:DNA-binding MarR family transcriptional regulator